MACTSQTALDQCSYPTVRNHATKAEVALASLSGPIKPSGEASSSSASRAANLPGMLNTNQPGRREEEARSKNFQMLGEKLSVAKAVADMGQGAFSAAARAFLNVSPPQTAPTSLLSTSRDSASNNTSHYISAADISLYGVLCGMASLDREQLKRMVLDNASLRPYLEHSPFLKDLIHKYYNSKFLEALQIVDLNKSRLLLDIHLSMHVPALIGKIKDKMLELYLEPFRAVKIHKMASAFGWSPKTLEEEVTKLIKTGQLKARMDKCEMVACICSGHLR